MPNSLFSFRQDWGNRAQKNTMESFASCAADQSARPWLAGFRHYPWSSSLPGCTFGAPFAATALFPVTAATLMPAITMPPLGVAPMLDLSSDGGEQADDMAQAQAMAEAALDWDRNHAKCSRP